MMFALNFAAVCYGLKSSVSHFLIHNKARRKRGARGEEPRRRVSAVPSPGHKKLKNQTKPRDNKILKFTFLFIIQLFSRGRNHLKTAINLSCYALLRNPNSDFPCGKDRCFLPRLPHFLGWAPLQKSQNYKRSVNSARERKETANIFNSPNKNQKTEFQSQTGLLVLPTPRFHSHAVRWMTGAPRGAESCIYISPQYE